MDRGNGKNNFEESSDFHGLEGTQSKVAVPPGSAPLSCVTLLALEITSCCVFNVHVVSR